SHGNAATRAHAASSRTGAWIVLGMWLSPAECPSASRATAVPASPSIVPPSNVLTLESLNSPFNPQNSTLNQKLGEVDFLGAQVRRALLQRAQQPFFQLGLALRRQQFLRFPLRQHGQDRIPHQRHRRTRIAAAFL